MMDSLQGKGVVVTGGANGIGRAVVRACIEEGAKCVFIDVDNEGGTALSTELGSSAIFVCGSVCSAETVEAAFRKCAEAFGGVDILVNNAGIVDFHDWERVMEVNLMALIRCTKLSLNHLRPGGAVVNVSSTAGIFYSPEPGMYSVSKVGVVTFTRHFAEEDSEAAAKNIRVSAICPGMVLTPLIESVFRVAEPRLLAKLNLMRDSAMAPEEVASAILHLAKRADSGSVWAIMAKGEGLRRVPDVNKEEDVVALLQKE